MAKTKELDVFGSVSEQSGALVIPDAEKFMKAYYYGTYIVPHQDRLDKKVEKRFRVALIVPKSLLQNNMNFHSHFKHTQADVFRQHNPEFVRFKNIIFDYATNLDGSEISDPRTFGLERLKQYCVDQKWNIDFHLYPGLKLREMVFQYFKRIDKVDESEAFYRKQEADRKLHGLSAQLRAEIEVIPESMRIEFQGE